MIDELIERSKIDLGNIPESVQTRENNDPILTIEPNDRIIVKPVWEFDISDIEGKKYKEYIQKYPAYNTVFARQTVIEMLDTATGYLPNQWKLVVISGHRPKEVQLAVFNEFYKILANKHPDLSIDKLLDLTRRYVSDPSRKLPPHCCGSAVDITAFDTSVEDYVDFGSKFNDPSPVSSTHDKTISDTAQKNRVVLLKAMLSAGFASLESEWWHFSYGDQNWAAFYQKPFALYDMMEVIDHDQVV